MRLPSRPPRRWPASLPARLGAATVALLMLATAAGLAGRPSPAAAALEPTSLVGFSFSPRAATFYGQDPDTALKTLLQRVRPDVVRLPVYWDAVAPAPNRLDYQPLDELLAIVDDYNGSHPERPARVVLVVGARNLDYPELHLPDWSQDVPLNELLVSPAYQTYLGTTIARYRQLPDLLAWQLENEPYDNVSGPGEASNRIPSSILTAELRAFHQADPAHQVVLTTFNNSAVQLDQRQMSPLAALYSLLPGPKTVGSMPKVLSTADVVGLDAYVVTPTTPLDQVGAAQRIAWKQQTMEYWAARTKAAGKELWVTEMQAAPWLGQDGFTPDDLELSAVMYHDHGPRVVLLWGVEGWLDSSSWMHAGLNAVRILRG